MGGIQSGLYTTQTGKELKSDSLSNTGKETLGYPYCKGNLKRYKTSETCEELVNKAQNFGPYDALGRCIAASKSELGSIGQAGTRAQNLESSAAAFDAFKRHEDTPAPFKGNTKKYASTYEGTLYINYDEWTEEDERGKNYDMCNAYKIDKSDRTSKERNHFYWFCPIGCEKVKEGGSYFCKLNNGINSEYCKLPKNEGENIDFSDKRQILGNTEMNEVEWKRDPKKWAENYVANYYPECAVSEPTKPTKPPENSCIIEKDIDGINVKIDITDIDSIKKYFKNLKKKLDMALKLNLLYEKY